jgi:serine/threonine protein kinase
MIKGQVVKISDFGFAKPIGDSLAVFSERCGTPYTMAPEIYFHNKEGSKPIYTHKCDIYSLGVILHELLYKKHPFDMCANRMRDNLRVKIP